jgi:hypothetical protein
MSKIEQFNAMDGYTFDEGVAFLVLVKAPLGVINHLKATHNRSHLHSEIHKQLRFPRVKEIVRRNMGNSPRISSNFPIANEPKSDKNEPKSHENEPKSDNIAPKSNETADEDETDRPPLRGGAATAAGESEIVLTKEDVRTHENTRIEDMPNDLCRTLWLKRQEVYREMQQAHLKMRNVPEGDENNEERAKWRAEVLRLDAENDNYWKQIDAEIERFKAEKEKAERVSPAFDVSTYRAYISKALRKKQLTPGQLAELQHRVDAMLKAHVELKPETLEKLKAVGVTV